MKKNIERWFISSFSKLYPEFPQGSIHAFEHPDFIVNCMKRKVGIEITGVFRDHNDGNMSMQSQESIQKRITNRAREIFEKRNGKSYNVFVSFNEKSKINGKKIDVLAQFIVGKVEDAITKKSQFLTKGVFLSGSDLEENRDIIFSIQVYKFETQDSIKWEHSNLHQIERLNIKSLEQAILKKERKSANYRYCDEMWLILVIDFWNPMMDAAIPLDFNFTIRKSKFNRIVIYKTAENVVRDLHISC